MLISWSVTLRDEPEERIHDVVSQGLYDGSAAENMCNVFAIRIKQRVIILPGLSVFSLSLLFLLLRHTCCQPVFQATAA